MSKSHLHASRDGSEGHDSGVRDLILFVVVYVVVDIALRAFGAPEWGALGFAFLAAVELAA